MEDKEDYYKMLGLQDLRWRASPQVCSTLCMGCPGCPDRCDGSLPLSLGTAQDIRKAYRQCVLKYHPDKMAQQSTENEEEKKEEVSLPPPILLTTDRVQFSTNYHSKCLLKAEQLSLTRIAIRRTLPRRILRTFLSQYVLSLSVWSNKRRRIPRQASLPCMITQTNQMLEFLALRIVLRVPQIRNHYKMGEYVEGNDVCPKGLENPEEKISRVRKYLEGKASNESEADQAFKALSQANSVLTDVQKRRAYDSKDAGADIDDSLPADRKPKDDADFFAMWAPVFERNARWSTNPMPSLGGPETPIEQVLDLYDKWFDMESWRDFSMEIEDAFDLDDASCREERRWMERQNKKQTETMKRNETNRINTMIETCHKWDPRVIKYKEELKNAKKAAKQSRFQGQKNAQEEAKRKADEAAAEKARAEEEAAARRKEEKEVREKAKRAGRLAKKALREAAEAKGLASTDPRVEAACAAWAMPGDADAKCSAEDLEALAAEIAAGSDASAALNAAMARLSLSPGPAPAAAPVAKPAAAPAAPAPAPSEDKKEKVRKWSRDEVNQLHKALIKFPAGTSQRWDKIAEFMVTRSSEECQRKCNELKNNFSANAAGMTADAQLEFARSKEEALKGHGSRSGKGTRTSGTAVVADREVGREGTTHFSKDASKGDNERKEETKGGAEDWSAEEQKALEAAMAEFKSSTLDVKEKWKAIAERVPGRTDKECIRRVKHIQSMLKGGS